MFSDEIQYTKQEIIEEKEEYPSMTPYFAGRALAMRLRIAKLKNMKKCFDDAEWLSYCSMSNEVNLQYEKLVNSIQDTVTNLFYKWIDNVGEGVHKRLDRYLMRPSPNKSGLLECNIDPKIINTCQEARYWTMWKFKFPISIQIIYDKWPTVKFVYESVLSVVLAYNKIIEGLFRRVIRSRNNLKSECDFIKIFCDFK